jgi:hypothetical protein
MRESQLTTILSLLWVAGAGAQEMAVDSAAPSSVASRDSAAPGREAVLEGREVVATRDVPGSSRVIGREELERSASLAEALGREPGVLVRSSGGLGGFSTLSLRGSPSEQVEVFLDGVPLGGSAGSKVDVGPVPLDGLDRARILQAGSEGSEGAPRLELVSRRGWARLGGSLRTGSFGERAASGWWGDADGATTVSGWWETSRNDYPFPWDNGTRYNTADDGIRRLANNDFTGWGAAGAWRPAEEWEGSLRLEGSDRGLSSPLVADPQARWDRQSVQGRLRWARTDEWGRNLELSWRRGWSHWRDPDLSEGYESSKASRERADDGDFSASLERRSGGWFDPRGAIAFRWEGSDRRSVGAQDVAVTPDGSRATASGTLGWSGRDGDRLGAEMSAREDLARDQWEFSTAMGTTVGSPDTSTLKAASRAQVRLWARQGIFTEWVSGAWRERLPDFSEWMGDNGGGLPRPSLGPEKSTTFEWGGRTEPGDLRLDLAGWYADYRDPILSEMAGSSPLVVHVNGPGYEVAGLDAAGSWCGRILSARLAGTLQKARIRDPNPSLDGKEPRRTPRWKGSAELSAQPGAGFRLGYSLDAQGETWATELNTADDHRPGRVLHGVWIRWKRGPVALSAAVRNLTDVHTEDDEDLPLSGRQFQARLEFDFARSPSATITNQKENEKP